MKENTYIAPTIDHTTDILERLVEYQSSGPISQPKNQERCENEMILEGRLSRFHGGPNLETVRLI